jgi:hypothetical protein
VPPQLILMTDKVVMIECPLLPVVNDEVAVQIAEQVSQVYCSKCGFFKGSVERNLKIMCFSSSDAYLAVLKEELKKRGSAPVVADGKS